MKTRFLLALFLFLNVALLAQSQDQILGKYWSPEKDAKIEIYKRNNSYFGKIIWAKNPRNDIKNPDPAKRNQPVVGMEFLKNFTFKNGAWEDGTIYDAESGKTYDCIIKLNEDNNIKVRGYIGISLIGRTETMERIKE